MKRKSVKFLLAAATVLALVIVLAAFNRDKRFEVFISELDGVTDEIVNVITANPSAAGVIRAREILTAKKDGLETKLASLQALTATQAHGEKLTQVEKALMRNSAKIKNLFKKEIERRQKELGHLRERVNESKIVAAHPTVTKAQQENKQFVDEMRQLLDDYESIIN